MILQSKAVTAEHQEGNHPGNSYPTLDIKSYQDYKMFLEVFFPLFKQNGWLLKVCQRYIQRN